MNHVVIASTPLIETSSPIIRRRSILARNIFFFALALVAWCAMVTSASAQYTKSSTLTDKLTPAGFAPGVPNGNIDTVNNFNGHVSVNFPLFTFGGRGEAGYTAYATIDRSFDIHVNQTWSAPGQYQGQWNNPFYTLTTEGFFEDLSRAEVKAGMKPGVIFVRKMRNGSPDPSPGLPDQISCNTLSKLYFRTSSGVIEFRDAGTNGLEQYMTSNNTFNRGKVWVSRDGSAMTFVSDTDIIDESCAQADYQSMNGQNVEFPSGYLYMKDGVRYRVVNGEVVWMRDRNGNTMTITGNSADTKTVTDSAGRTYTIQTLASGGAIQSQSVQYKGFGGTPHTISVAYTLLENALRTDAINRGGVKSLGQLFPEISWQIPTLSLNPTVLSEITLADGKKYRFKYNEFAELARIEHPNGSIAEFDYAPVGMGNGVYFAGTPQINRRAAERRFYDTEGVLSSRTTYERAVESNGSVAMRVKVYDGDGTHLSYTKHYYIGSVEDGYNYSGFYPPYSDGKEFKTEACDLSGNPLIREEYNWVPDTNSTALLSEVKTTLVATNQVKKVTHSYDQYANVTDTYTYDYGNGAAGALFNRTHTGYVTDTAYTARTGAHLRSLVREAWVSSDAAGVNRAAFKEVEYDNYTPDPSNGNRHAALVSYGDIYGLCMTVDASLNCVTSSDSSTTTRGNVTGTTSYLLNASGNVTGSVTTNQQYDVAGNVIKTIDARGTSTTIEYNDKYGIPDTEAKANSAQVELGAQSSYAFPTRATNAMGHVSYAQFDYHTGQTVNTEDANGVVSSVDICVNGSNCDLLDRPRLAIHDVNNLAGKSSTVLDYDDVNRVLTSRSDLNAFGDGLLRSETLYDGLGRTIETRKFETATTYIKTKQEYDALGRIKRSTNPYRTGETIYWTTTAYDALGRATKVTMPDGAEVNNYYSGAQVLVKDQAGKERLSLTNALGQLKEVWEITSADDSTEAITFPGRPEVVAGYRTKYDYDTLGNLITITQRKGTNGALQTRSFAYDSLSRLTSATNLEIHNDQGVAVPVTYQYDNNGNLTQKTDARNITTLYDYDLLNRVISRTYQNDSTATPPVYYKYDSQSLLASAPTFSRGSSVGRLVAVIYGDPTTSTTGNYQGYDALGRVKRSIQRTNDGQADQTYTFANYDYDLAGNLTSQTYPSGRIVTSSYDNGGRLSGVNGQKTGETSKPYASQLSYSAHGAVAEMKLGNNLWEHTIFNNRLQPALIGLGTSADQNAAAYLNRFRVDYYYGTTDNNGNVLHQTISVPDNAGNYVAQMAQVYTYDELNRLKSAQENGGASWKQIYKYDRFGNRTFDSGTTIPAIQPNVPDPLNNPDLNPADNRIAINQGYGYDFAGNLTSAPNKTFSYDAENRIASYNGGNPQNGGGKFFYDGDGRRVKKVASSGTTVFVYNAMGQLIAEHTDTPPLPDSGGTRYLTADSLGTPRIITGADGSVKARHDYLPFGEEIAYNVGGRSDSQKYVYGTGTLDNVRQKFTQYERDSETGLDYAQARYYANVQGRFTSVDPLLASAKAALPQSWNRYTYALNNPLKFIDPSGLEWRRNDKTGGMKWYYKDDDRTGTTEYTERRYIAPDGREVELNPNGPDHNADPSNHWLRHGWDYVVPVSIFIWNSTLSSMPSNDLSFSNFIHGLGGHVSYGIGGVSRSWEGDGWADPQAIEDYIQHNTAYRSGTEYVIDGGAAFNRNLAEGIFPHGYDGTQGYNIIQNNCGEAFCRAINRTGLPRDDYILPRQHASYIEATLGSRGLVKEVIAHPQRYVAPNVETPVLNVGP